MNGYFPRQRGTIVLPLHPSVYDTPTIDRYARGINPNTKEVYLIHSQGVSYRVTHSKPWRFNDFSVRAHFFTIQQVREFPTMEPIDLADWIHTFGARLETNFRLAFDALNRTEPLDPEYSQNLYELFDDAK